MLNTFTSLYMNRPAISGDLENGTFFWCVNTCGQNLKIKIAIEGNCLGFSNRVEKNQGFPLNLRIKAKSDRNSVDDRGAWVSDDSSFSENSKSTAYVPAIEVAMKIFVSYDNETDFEKSQEITNILTPSN
jgi:hypothetical protein